MAYLGVLNLNDRPAQPSLVSGLRWAKTIQRVGLQFGAGLLFLVCTVGLAFFLYIWLLKPKEISMVIVQSGVAFEISLKISN